MSRWDDLPRLAEATGESVAELQRLQAEVHHLRGEAERALLEMQAITDAVGRMSTLAGRWLHGREADLARRRVTREQWADEMAAADLEAAAWWRAQMHLRGFSHAEAPPPTALH